MKNVISSIRLSLIIAIALCAASQGLAQTTLKASVKIDSDTAYQKITGFGGFVCSGTFAYNHMTPAEIRKVWGKDSEAGYNIMRLYIPIADTNASPANPSTWSQSLATAQLARSLGIITFASPWSMPAAWKAYNTIDGGYNNAGTMVDNYLLTAHYEDYANYLNNYATYLRDNGAELDAISVQNEPDMRTTYAGCIWTPQQIANFVRDYGRLIDCPIIAAEGVGITDNYSAAFADDAVIDQYTYYAGHQYSIIQNGLEAVRAKGKEVWMTEYLINWNANLTTPRNFNWRKDGFDFAAKVNSALLSNVSAWIHYATKRFYGLMGDGTYGTTNGVMTKRGHILSHFAKYTIGTTRIEQAWKDASGKLNGSAYLTASGDSVVVMVINPTDTAFNLTIDLPFYTLSGKSVRTSEQENMVSEDIALPVETCRPQTTIDPLTFNTFIFVKSSSRPESQMTGTEVHYNTIENQVVTDPAFGTGYQLSGKTIIFDNSRKLISANTNKNNGYLALDDRYNQMVFHIKKISSALTYTSANTTLFYINNKGNVNSHNYGTIIFNPNGNFNWKLDISPKVLTDGCIGILGISNSNYSSILTITFGDVFFSIGDEKMFSFSGIYSEGDSDELDCLEDISITSIDYTNTTGITAEQDWFTLATNKNCIYYADSGLTNTNRNVVVDGSCSDLELSDESGNFYSPFDFTSGEASYSCSIDSSTIITLPFEADIPTGASVYTLEYTSIAVSGTKITSGKIPANTPVLVVGSGTFVFNGTGNVSTPHNISVNDFYGVYIASKAWSGSYYLKTVNGISAFHKVKSGYEPTIMPFSGYLRPGIAVDASHLPLKLDGEWMHTCKVSFNTQSEVMMDTLIAPYYTTISAPVQPILAGHTFAGWYKEPALTNAWNFGSDIVDSSLTLYAKWTINSYTVSFNSMGGSDIASKQVSHNTAVSAPQPPVKEGNTFEGWFREVECINAWDFDLDLITSDSTLYAKWEAVVSGITSTPAMVIGVYPNPVKDIFVIESSLPVITCEVYTLQGKALNVLRQGKTVDVSHLPGGVYIVKITTADHMALLKIIRE